ncbi:cytochrome P450, partial [Oryctes borbonicus]
KVVEGLTKGYFVEERGGSYRSRFRDEKIKLVQMSKMEASFYKEVKDNWDLTRTLLFVFILLFLAYCYWKRNFSYWTNKHIPCEKPFLFLGNFPDMIASKQTVPQYLANLYAKYQNEPYFGIYLFNRPALVLRDPKLIKNVLIKNFAKFPNRAFTIDKSADVIACSSLFAVKNPEWKALRAKLTPIFTSGKLKMMLPLIKECCTSLKNYLDAQNDKVVDMKEVCGKYATDVISSCTFGVNACSLVNEDSEFRVMGKRLFNSNLIRKVSAFGYFLAPAVIKVFKLSFLDREATVYLNDLFWRILHERESNMTRRNDLVDILIDLKNDNDKSISFDGVTVSSQAVSFFSAGHETTSSTISFALYEMAINQDVQDRLRDEIHASVRKYGDITYEGVKEMRYLNMVFCEVLRKYTQAPFLIRECVEDCFIPEYNLRADKGTDVIIPIAGLHADPKYYPDPQKFDPLRFSDVNREKLTPYSYLPFGSGPRNCIGFQGVKIGRHS